MFSAQISAICCLGGVLCVETLRGSNSMRGDMDVRESTPTHTQIQLEAAINSAHGLLKVGLIEQATDLLTAFLPKEVNG